MKGYLHLSEGISYKGTWVGKQPDHDISGEIVFFTGMTGYQEVLTNPSYKGQIVVFTYPQIGNYGMNKVDAESQKPQPAAVIVYEAALDVFHYEAEMSIAEYLQKWDVPVLSHIDTRAVVKKIREHGSMPAVLSQKQQIDEPITIEQSFIVNQVSTKQPMSYGDGKYHIVLIDYGYKKSLLDSLLIHDCKVTVVPYTSTFEYIQTLQPDGILLSNGPGNPKDLKAGLPQLKQVIQRYPTLGVGLGHQLAALAFGADTKKMLHGHRGGNPVYDQQTGKVFMSSQNHSYVVEEESLHNTGLHARYTNGNDGSIEGLYHHTLPLVTVQFHPEAHPGPADSVFIFTEFINLVETTKRRVVNYA